ncbi:MAG: SusF/SusE family outer membrane protein, partial [Muribaculaceae bacterium]|nr:SusF/SusE family outer membrane protein [Muribaculaceae bacterium]
MKKSLLFAGFAAMALFAGAQNPFAYNISNEPVAADATEMTLHYTLNADAVNVGVTFYADGVEVSSMAINGENTKGEHSTTVSLEGLPTGKEITWAVFAEGQALNAPTEFTPFKKPDGSALGIWGPYGIAVDNNPQSAHFGRILFTDSHAGVLGNSNYFSVSDGVGLGVYELDPQLNFVKNAAGTYGYDGGIGWTKKNYQDYNIGSGNSQIFGPKRVKISKDGRIFVSVADLDHSPIYELNPDNLNEWTAVFPGEYAFGSDNAWIMNGEEKIATAVHGFDVTGEGENLRLLVHSNDMGYAFSAAHNYTIEYALGTAKQITEPGTVIEPLSGNNAETQNPQYSEVAYDPDGNGMWYLQYRELQAEGATNYTNWAHFTFGQEDLDLEENATNGYTRQGAGITFSPDGTQLVVAANSRMAVVYKVGGEEEADIQAGNMKLTKLYDLPFAFRTTRTDPLNAIAMDVAGNVYSCTNNAEKIGYVSLPREEPVCEVPARAEFAFTLEEAVEPILNLSVVGSFQTPEWNTDAAVEMEMTDNNVFVKEIEFPANTLFKLIEKLDGAIKWYGGQAETDTYWISPDMIENATPIELVDGSNFLIDDAGIYIINVDAMTHMMTVTKKEVVPVEPKYYAIGTFQENPWVTEEAWEMENNEVTIDLEAGGKFKIITPADDTENGYRYFGGEDANDVGYFLVEEGMMEAGIALTLDSPGADFMIEEGGNFTLRLIKDEDVAPSGMPKAPVEGMKLLVIRNSTTGIN